MSESIVRSRDDASLYQEVCRIVAQEGPFPLVWVGLVRGREVVAVAHAGPAHEYLRSLRVEVEGELATGPTGRCIRENLAVVNDDFEANPSTLPWREAALRHGFRASAALPLRRDGKVAGALTLYAARPGTFDPEQIELLEALCADVSYALDALDHERQRTEAERALRRSEQGLREADRRKTQFLAVLSHELRNPLTPIRNSLYILERAAPGGEQALRAQQVIDRQVTQLAVLVNDLLDATRITRNKIHLQKERLDLDELVRRTAEDNRPAFEKNGIRLEVTAAPAPIWVQADRTRAAQIVVADDGIGMTPPTLARLFQPFMQADESLDRSKGGLGLGLALVKGLVELHGGTVNASSAGLGLGSVFTIRLPLEPPGAGEPAARPIGRARNRRRVLVIEDNVDAAESLRELLELEEQEVEVASNGPDGIARALTFAPEIVLCDIGLPGMDGYEVARAFRADEALRSVALVAVSGYALPEDLQRAARAGFDRHLAKPPTLEKLVELLDELPG